jgi:hypothetical protein
MMSFISLQHVSVIVYVGALLLWEKSLQQY